MKPMNRALALVGLAILLSSCSMTPIFTEVDLKNHIQETEGSLQKQIAAGSTPHINLETIKTIEFDDESISMRLVEAQLHYDVNLAYEGPDLTGGLTARVFLAPTGEDDLFQDKYLLASEILALEDRTEFELAGSVAANEAQLNAVNEGKLRIGIQVMGSASADSAGAATFHYRIDTLKLRVGISIL